MAETWEVKDRFCHGTNGLWSDRRAEFDAWLEAERQAARNETAKAIRDECLRFARPHDALGFSAVGDAYAAASRAAASHITDPT